MGPLDELRETCAWVAARARHVRIEQEAVAPYAAALPAAPDIPALDAAL